MPQHRQCVSHCPIMPGRISAVVPTVFMRFVIALVLLVAVVTRQGYAAEPIISEFMPDNARILADEDGEFADWLEVHNPNATSIDLAGYYLSDDPLRLTKWAFPSVTLSPNGY